MDIKRSILLCRTSLQQIVELFQTVTLIDTIFGSPAVSGAFMHTHVCAQRRAASISHLGSSCSLAEPAPLDGLAPWDNDLLLICVGGKRESCIICIAIDTLVVFKYSLCFSILPIVCHSFS